MWVPLFLHLNFMSREFHFLISINGNTSSWRHTVIASGLEDAILQLKTIACLKTWRPMAPEEVEYALMHEKNRG
jgi:hypothetical protein